MAKLFYTLIIRLLDGLRDTSFEKSYWKPDVFCVKLPLEILRLSSKSAIALAASE